MKLKLLTTLLLLFIFQSQIQAQVILDSDSSVHIAEKELAIIDNDTIKLQKLILLCENCYQQISSSQIKYQPNDRCLAYHAYGSQLLALAEKIGDVEGKIIGSFYTGLEMELRNKETEAEKLYLQWYELRKKEQIKTKNALKLRWVYDYLSQFYMRTLQIEKAEKILKIWYSEALKQKNTTWTHHHVARKLGYFYYQIGEYEKAASYYNLALDENAFPISEYIAEISRISKQFIADGYTTKAIKNDNVCLERLKKEKEQLYETSLRECVTNHKAGETYQLFFLQKFYEHISNKQKQNYIDLYQSFPRLPVLPKNIQRECIKRWLLCIDKNVILPQTKSKEYMILFNILSYNVGFDVEFQVILEDILPRVEKISQNKTEKKQKIYNRTVEILQNLLLGNNKNPSMKKLIPKIEKLKNKVQKDEADQEFLLKVQKELNFARKINDYNFWGR